LAEYPKDVEREVTLKNGARVRVRPILPEDEARLVTLYGRLSRHTAYERFFTVMKRLPANWAHHFANVDYRRRMALVVERDLEWRPEVIGVAMYEASEEGETAEVAIVIQDHWQGRGLGCIRPAVRRARPDHRLLAANLLFEFLSLIALGR
jgi:acetyltransferase